jgi:thiol-disulfide isomerase/thioredoxin
MGKRFKSTLSFLLLAVCMLGCNACKDTDESIPEEVSLITWDDCGYQQGEHMCDFSLQDQNGDDFDLYDYIGQPIVLDYSTMWCGYCQVAAADVSAISANYSEYDLLYVTILIENTLGEPADVADCDDWASIFGIIDAPVLAGSRELIDPDGKSGISLSGWPTFLFLTDEMVIETIVRGYSEGAIDWGIQIITTE